MRQQQFTQWLAPRNPGAVNAYPRAINEISQHYSAADGNAPIDVYQINDLQRLEEIRMLYQTGQKYGEFGNSRGGLFRAAINKYRNFFEETGGGDELEEFVESSAADGTQTVAGSFAYERDLQAALWEQRSELFPQYKNARKEFPVDSGRIDILLENDDEVLVMELKSGLAGDSVFGQIFGYIGSLQNTDEFRDKKISGVIIAGEFSDRLRAACSVMPDRVSLKTYKMRLELNDD